MSFEWTRCAASTASGPRKSHLLSGETSHMPTPSRTAAYSDAGSPNETLHNQPPSSMNVAPRASWTAWNAVRDRHRSRCMPPRRRVDAAHEPAPRRYTPSLNRCSTRRGWPPAVRTRSPTVDSASRATARVARTRNAWAVTSASSKRIVRVRHRDAESAGRRRQAVPEDPSAPRRARRRPRSPGSGRRSCAGATTTGSGRRSPTGSAPPRRRTRPTDSGRGSRLGARAAPDPAGERPPGPCGRSSWIFCEERRRRDIGIDQLMDARRRARRGHRAPAPRRTRRSRRARSPARSPRSRARRTRRPATSGAGRGGEDRRPSSGPLDPHDARLRDDGVARGGRSGRSAGPRPPAARRTRSPIRSRVGPGAREEPVVEPAPVPHAPARSVERDARRDHDVDRRPGRAPRPSAGSRAPNDVSVTASPGANARGSRSPSTIRGSADPDASRVQPLR